MRFVIKTLLLSTVVAMAVSMPSVYADSCGLKDKINRVEQRIDHGIADGRFTHDEVRWLEHQKREIRMLARELREDGHMSRKDCRILAHRIEHLNDSVTRLKHNDRTDGNRPESRHHYDDRRGS